MVTRIFLVMAALAFSVMAQVAPVKRQSMGELLGTASTTISDPHSVAVVRTSSTVLTIASSASATAPQSLRFGGTSSDQYFLRQYTSANTLTSTSGGATGTIWIYALPVTTGSTSLASLQTVVINDLGGTLTCTGTPTCTVVARTAALARQAIASGLYLAAATMTAGAPATFDSSGLSVQSQGQNAWLKGMIVTNNTGSATSLTITDGKGTPVPVVTGATIAANSSTFIAFTDMPDQLVFFERGLKASAGAVSSLYVTLLWRTMPYTYSPAAPQ